MKNMLFKNFGIFLNTANNEQFKIKKVYLFKDGKIKIIDNYFLDNFENYRFDFNGETKRKLKIDLTYKTNFVVKSKEQDSLLHNNVLYNLYINCDTLNVYKLEKLALNGNRLDIVYTINNIKCNHCLGWNYKKSQNIKYNEFEKVYKNCNHFNIDNVNYEKELKKLNKLYRQYKQAKEEEKTYTEKDYKKMSLVSGTTEEENKLILNNNNFEV